MIKKLIFIIGMASVISGCAGMQDNFSCTKIDGVKGCSSMTDIHNMVDGGDISADEEGHIFQSFSEPEKAGGKAARHSKKERENGIRTSNIMPKTIKPTPMNASVSMLRKREVVGKFVLFPYEDKDKNLHDKRVIYSVIRPATWLSPVVSEK